MFCIYILFSKEADKYYIGQTDDLDQRLQSHLSGISRYTSIVKDWKLVYSEKFETRREAIVREREIKAMKSRKYIERLISDGN